MDAKRIEMEREFISLRKPMHRMAAKRWKSTRVGSLLLDDFLAEADLALWKGVMNRPPHVEPIRWAAGVVRNRLAELLVDLLRPKRNPNRIEGDADLNAIPGQFDSHLDLDDLRTSLHRVLTPTQRIILDSMMFGKSLSQKELGPNFVYENAQSFKRRINRERQNVSVLVRRELCRQKLLF